MIARIADLSGTVMTAGDVTFSGYGVFVVAGNILFADDVTTDASADETTLGLYADEKIIFQAGNLHVSGQLFAQDNVIITGNSTISGSITSRDKVIFSGTATLYYQPASPTLTEPFWPMNQ